MDWSGRQPLASVVTIPFCLQFRQNLRSSFEADIMALHLSLCSSRAAYGHSLLLSTSKRVSWESNLK